MAGTPLNHYNLEYHFEAQKGGTQAQGGCIANIGPSYQADVLAAAGDYTTLKTVLSNNGLLFGSGTLVIDSVQAAPSGSQIAFVA